MPKSILHIDDEPAVAAAVAVRLRSAGHTVFSACNGADGLAMAREHQPDIILLDIRMPGMDGFATCRELKSDSSTANIPVIFLSANVQEVSQIAAVDAGAAGFLTKPFDPQQLLSIIESALNDTGDTDASQ